MPGVAELLGAGVFYGAAVSEAPAISGSEVYVVGGGNSTGQAAVHLARFARRVTVLARGDSLDRTMSEYVIKEVQASDVITVRPGTRVVAAEGAGRLERVRCRTSAAAGRRRSRRRRCSS